MEAVGSGYAAFRERLFNADPQGGKSSLRRDDWDRWEARCLRYNLYWALYQNNSYSDAIHAWSRSRKASLGLYKHTRHVYNPAYRCGKFWTSHLMGGPLSSALPIVSENPAIEDALGVLWRDSNWGTAKETWTRFGAVLGDVGLRVVDDKRKAKVRLEPVHPGHIKWCQFDPYGNVKSYIIQRWEYDPRVKVLEDANPLADPRALVPTVLYTERAYRDGEDVVFETLLNGQPYAWNGEDSAWSQPYGFVPLVVAHHEPIGMDWAMNAFHPGMSRFLEVDDLGSGVTDQIRKAIRAPMLLTGVNATQGVEQGRGDGQGRGRSAQADGEGPERQADREDLPFLYGPVGADAKHLTFNLDIPGAIAKIASLNNDIEKNFPELLADTGNISGAITATAMKMLRQRASADVLSHRPNYDGPLVRAQQMAMAIGGHWGYPGYDGFDLGSYAAGKLAHEIGDRPVFEVDSRDAIEEDSAFWGAAAAAKAVGVPLRLYLRRNGWSEADIDELIKAQAEEAASAPKQAAPAA